MSKFIPYLLIAPLGFLLAVLLFQRFSGTSDLSSLPSPYSLFFAQALVFFAAIFLHFKSIQSDSETKKERTRRSRNFLRKLDESVRRGQM